MSRPLRIEFAGAWYHVMNRGRRREDIFHGKSDFKLFMGNLEYAAALFNVRVAAWCLMINHYHLMVHTPEGNLSRFMRHIDGVYTQRFNKTHRVDGQLFRGRYKSILIDPNSDRHMLAVAAYIHLNPQKAGLEKEIGLYAWSSWQAYTTRQKKWQWVDTAAILDRFSGTLAQKRIAFQRYVQAQSVYILDEIFDPENETRAWGEQPFLLWLKKTFYLEKQHHQVPQARTLAPAVEEILAAVSSVYDVDQGELFVSRRGVFNEPRNVAMYLLRFLRGDTLLDIGRHFGIKRYSSVNSVISRIEHLRQQEKGLNQRIENAAKNITKEQEESR